MKKLLLAFLCCLIVCGCEDWKKDFQTSDIKIEVTNGLKIDTYITYTIKNISDYNCNSMKAIIEFKNGSIATEEIIYPPIYSSSPLKPNNALTDEYTFLGKNYEGYTASFKEVNCYDKDTK